MGHVLYLIEIRSRWYVLEKNDMKLIQWPLVNRLSHFVHNLEATKIQLFLLQLMTVYIETDHSKITKYKLLKQMSAVTR